MANGTWFLFFENNNGKTICPLSAPLCPPCAQISAETMFSVHNCRTKIHWNDVCLSASPTWTRTTVIAHVNAHLFCQNFSINSGGAQGVGLFFVYGKKPGFFHLAMSWGATYLWVLAGSQPAGLLSTLERMGLRSGVASGNKKEERIWRFLWTGKPTRPLFYVVKSSCFRPCKWTLRCHSKQLVRQKFCEASKGQRSQLYLQLLRFILRAVPRLV